MAGGGDGFLAVLGLGNDDMRKRRLQFLQQIHKAAGGPGLRRRR